MTKLTIKMPLILKIVLVILLIVSSIGAVVVVYIGRSVNNSLLEAKKETINLVSVEQTKEIGQIMNFARQSADAVPTIPGVAEYLDKENKTVQDKTVLDSLVNFGAGRKFLIVFLMDTTGLTMVSTDPTLVGKNFAFRKYFQEALAGEQISEMAIGSVTFQPGFFFSAPVKNIQGKIVGVSAVKMDPQPMFEALIDSYINRLGKFMLVNDDGVIIFSNKQDALYKSLGVMNEEVMKQIKTERRYLDREILPLDYDVAQKRIESKSKESYSYEFFDDVDNEDELIEVNRVGEFPLYFVTEVSSSTVRNVVGDLVRFIIFFIVGSLILGVVLIIFVLRKFLRPLSTLDDYAKEVSSGNYSKPISVKTGDEMESLTESVKEMVGNLRDLSAGLEKTVAEKTLELKNTLKSTEGQNIDLERTKRAVMNVMEDLSFEKDRMVMEKNRLETILTSIGDGVFVTDEEGKITLINKMAQVMSGYTSFEVLGKHYKEHLDFRMEDNLEAEYPDFVKKVLDTGKLQSLANHTVIVRKDGVVTSVLDSAAPVKNIDGKVYGCVVVFRDNTHERELEKSKDDFLSVTSHQLRTPLGSMRWNLEMLLDGDAGELSSEAKAIAAEAHKGNLRMIELVNDLLNVNRIDQGRVMDEPAKSELGQIVRDAAAELKFEAGARKIKVNLDLRKVPKIIIDPKRFREVIMNLVSNAVKYNNPGGKVDVEMKAEDGQIVITVEDNGVGVPKKDMANLFMKFYRATNAVHSETEGSGLGLYVVKKFVEGWGGSIKLVSTEGKGTNVTVILPVNIPK